VGESGIDADLAARLVRLAGALRALRTTTWRRPPRPGCWSTRRRWCAAAFPARGCHAALVEPLTDDAETLAALREVIDVTLG